MRLLNKFRRATSTGNYIPEIDGLRFLAISWIFIFHLNDYLSNFFPVDGAGILQMICTNGHLGVELFFVISGFVLSLPFARYYLQDGKRVYLKNYYLRRLTRLEPPYFLVMISLFFFLIAQSPYTIEELSPHLIASLFYSHNIIYPGTLPAVNSVAWSLEIEIQFYLMVPILVRIFTFRKLARRLVLLFAVITMPIIQHLFKTETLFLYQFIQYFIAGFLLTDIYISFDLGYFNKINRGFMRNILSFIGVIIFFAILIIPSTREGLVYTIFIPLMILLFYSIVLFVPFWRKLFSVKWVSIIGGMCYTIYLIHLPIIAIFGKFFVKYKLTDSYFLYLMWQFFILGTIVMIFSSLFFYFVEKPCMQKDWYFGFSKKLQRIMSG